ncbi:MAG: hypothetical protein LUD57_06310 [Ruminococcus sp.]|nr:hypothetical protein [Ruminococcus sp.]
MNDLNDPLSEGLYTVGKVTVDKNFHTQSADEEFFRFFGNDVIYSIKRTVHEKDFPRLEGCVASAVCGEALRTVVRMKGVDTDFRWMLATVKMLSATSAELLYSITLSDIFSLEALAYSRERRYCGVPPRFQPDKRPCLRIQLRNKAHQDLYVRLLS